MNYKISGAMCRQTVLALSATYPGLSEVERTPSDSSITV